MDFRKIISKEMKRKKVKVPFVARKAGFNQVSLYNYLAQRSELNSSHLGKVLDALEIKVEHTAKK